ncbi:hypothetical protein SprV_0100008600 [Sparganum proliferum]
MFSVILMDAYRDERPRSASPTGQTATFSINDGCTSSRVYPQPPSTFADDCIAKVTTEGDMQRSMDPFSAACENFGLIVNTKKTVVMQQPPPDAAYVAPQISVNGAQLKAVDNFTYLGSTLSRSTKIDD